MKRGPLVLAAGLVLAIGVGLFMLNQPLKSTLGGDCGTGLRSEQRFVVEHRNGVTVPVGDDTCADAVSTNHIQTGIAVGVILVITGLLVAATWDRTMPYPTLEYDSIEGTYRHSGTGPLGGSHEALTARGVIHGATTLQPFQSVQINAGGKAVRMIILNLTRRADTNTVTWEAQDYDSYRREATLA